MKQSLWLLLFISTRLFAQADTAENGVKFIKNPNWDQVFAKAKAENKYVFIDCYTTWCVPCRNMDRKVYTDSSVGSYLNEKFICVKIQMDTAKQDNEEARNYYSTANRIMTTYKVIAFPTYLFLSPEGKIVHKGIGFLNVRDFLSLANNSQSPTRQYFTLLDQYLKGQKDYKTLPYLANSAQQFKENELALTISHDYIDNYLLKLNGDNLYSKENIEFMVSFIKSTKDKCFPIFYLHHVKVDSVMKSPGFAERAVDYVITKEYIDPYMQRAQKDQSDPDWQKIARNIKKKFRSSYVERNILSVKARWYKFKENWKEFTNNLVWRVDNYGSFGIGIPDFDLNNHAWDIFLYSDNKTYLEKALVWSEKAVKLNNDANKATWMDTYANLLYKLGRREEAIEVEQKAVALSLGPKQKELKEALEKMKKNEPTWPSL